MKGYIVGEDSSLIDCSIFDLVISKFKKINFILLEIHTIKRQKTGRYLSLYRVK